MSKTKKASSASPRLTGKLLRRVKRILDIKTELEAVKPLYSELDELTVELVKLGMTHWVDPKTKITFEIVDNFASKNTAFKACGVKRYEVKIK